jgi:hypothetical protein
MPVKVVSPSATFAALSASGTDISLNVYCIGLLILKTLTLFLLIICLPLCSVNPRSNHGVFIKYQYRFERPPEVPPSALTLPASP